MAGLGARWLFHVPGLILGTGKTLDMLTGKSSTFRNIPRKGTLKLESQPFLLEACF